MNGNNGLTYLLSGQLGEGALCCRIAGRDVESITFCAFRRAAGHRVHLVGDETAFVQPVLNLHPGQGRCCLQNPMFHVNLLTVLRISCRSMNLRKISTQRWLPAPTVLPAASVLPTARMALEPTVVAEAGVVSLE